MEQVCPRGRWMLNYTNPMAMLCWAVTRATQHARSSGCATASRGQRGDWAYYCDVPHYELEYDTAGINHMAWYTKLKWNGQDLYPVETRRSRSCRRPTGSGSSKKR